jgi:hypothetical protein
VGQEERRVSGRRKRYLSMASTVNANDYDSTSQLAGDNGDIERQASQLMLMHGIANKS